MPFIIWSDGHSVIIRGVDTPLFAYLRSDDCRADDANALSLGFTRTMIVDHETATWGTAALADLVWREGDPVEAPSGF